MTLPASQQRDLDAIENRLAKREPRLASMFAIFTRLASGEALPRREALQLVPWWSPHRWSSPPDRSRPPGWVRALVLLSLAAIMIIAVVFAAASTTRTDCALQMVGRTPLIVQAHPPGCMGAGHGR